jgi:hypothetical protein
MKDFEQAFKLLNAELDRIRQDMNNGDEKPIAS